MIFHHLIIIIIAVILYILWKRNFDEKIITEREGNLILATASDDVLGEDAATIRSRILRSLLLRLDRKGN